MKKKILTAVVAMIVCCVSGKMYAEDNNAVLWGIKASVDAEFPGKWHGDNNDVSMYRHGYGFTIGAVSNIYLGNNFYFEPGVSLFYSQYKYKDLIIMEDDVTPSETDPKLYKWGFQIPLVFGYTFDLSERFAINVFTGPQLRYAFAGKIDVKNRQFIEEMDDDFDLWGVNGQHRLDCAWKVGFGFPIRNFNLSVEADLGITDLLKGDMKFRENRIAAALTYYF